MLPLFLRTILMLVLLALTAPAAQASSEAAATLAEAEALLAGEGLQTGRELTPVLHDLRQQVEQLDGAERRRALRLLARPDNDPSDDDAFAPGVIPQTQCSANFCVHAVGSGPDAGLGQMVLTLAEAEAIRAVEVGTLGWREPPSDEDTDPKGDGRTDIYLKDLYTDTRKLFGYAQSEGGSSAQQASYLVIDNDFDPAEYGAPALDSLRVTLAHEYGHVLQYGYDVTADGWHYESTAVWLEQRVFPDLKDWLRFVDDRGTGQGWRSLTEIPLTAYSHPDDERTAHEYGAVVWNQFLDARYGAAGDDLIRGTWERSDGFTDPSTHAYHQSIRAAGGNGLASDYAAFAAAIAEWGTAGSSFPRADELPDVERRGPLTTDGAPVAASMDHLTFALYDVPATTAGQIRLAATFPAGVPGAIALVGRVGDDGPVTTEITELPTGGAGGVTLANPSRFAGGRITGVLVNASSAHGPWDDDQDDDLPGDWTWSHENQAVSARVTSAETGPTVTSRTPAPGATGVSTRPRITATFSEAVTGVNTDTVVLRDPAGQKVPATVSYAAATRTATLTPTSALADTGKHKVEVSGAILNAAANPVTPVSWEFTTVRRAPRARLTLTSFGFRLRSRDRDPLEWTARLRRGGRTLQRLSGTLPAGATRELVLDTGRAKRARLVVTFTDPQGNTTTLRRWRKRLAARSSAEGI